MSRHLPRFVLVGALLSPATLYALGLGEIKLNSALNQPFDADIELVAPTSDELASLKVGLASNDLFSRFDLDRPAYLSNFDFAVSRSPNGRVSVKVTSNRSVTEPFVTLLIEATWSRGRLLREYTVLLDPPVFMPAEPQAPAAVTAPQAGGQAEGRIERAPTPPPAAEPAAPAVTRQEPAVEETPAASQEPAAPAPVVSAGGSYAVQRNDTLWRIASDIRPGSPRVVNQTMIALFRANPDAFDDNINRLRAGSVLRIPELAEIQSLSTSEASAEVVRQTEEWRGSVAAPDTQEPARLRLVTPAEETPAPIAATPEEPVAAAAEEGTGAASEEDRRMEVGSPDLEGLQQQVDEAPVEPATGELVAEEEPVAAEPEAQEPVAAEPRPEPVQQEVQPAPAAEPEPSLLERIGEFAWVFVIGGLLVLFGLIVVFLKRRREEVDLDDSLDTLAAPAFEPRSLRAAPGLGAGLGAGFGGLGEARSREEDLDIEPVMPEVEDFDQPHPAVAAAAGRAEPQRAPAVPPEAEGQAAEAKVGEDTLSSETAVRFDQQDALAEADFHMAYGLYDQAADLVKIAIDREPERRDLKLKLLEIYFVWGNRDLFLETARDLHATREQAAAGEWDKILIMGRQIAPEDAMFKGETTSGHVDLVDVNLEGGENRIDVDLFAEPGGDKPAGLDLEFGTGEHKAVTGAAKGEDSDLDFLLDEPRRGADEDPTRELDPLARTQETPTIESPRINDGNEIDRTSQTVREKVGDAFAKTAQAEQTAELSLDDMDLDVDALESTGTLEETSSLQGGVEADVEPEVREGGTSLSDDEMTQLAPSLDSVDRTMEAPRPARDDSAKDDTEITGTIYLDQVDLSPGDTVEQVRPDIDSTASLRGPAAAEESKDALDDFSEEVFGDSDHRLSKLDLDVGEPLGGEDYEPTRTQNTQLATEMELSELEPVTMSEVGTKLDLARAYMDMGDPDGARSILDEVLTEGNHNQKQEAARLMESIR